jgi:hypothetical protein
VYKALHRLFSYCCTGDIIPFRYVIGIGGRHVVYDEHDSGIHNDFRLTSLAVEMSVTSCSIGSGELATHYDGHGTRWTAVARMHCQGQDMSVLIARDK